MNIRHDSAKDLRIKSYRELGGPENEEIHRGALNRTAFAQFSTDSIEIWTAKSYDDGFSKISKFFGVRPLGTPSTLKFREIPGKFREIFISSQFLQPFQTPSVTFSEILNFAQRLLVVDELRNGF